MALHFGFEKINNGNFQEVVYDPCLLANGEQETTEDGEKLWKLKPTTDTLIWATMWLGMNKITKKNYRKFYTRLRLYNDVFGPALYHSEASNVVALWVENGEVEDQYLVASKTVYSAVHFARNHYVQDLGGQDDPEFWKQEQDVASETFENWPHGEYIISVEGKDGEVHYTLRGSVLLSDRKEVDSINLQVVKDHIGLWTNASTKTDAQFKKTVYDRLLTITENKVKEEAFRRVVV